ncbi:MAG: hypothetical protein R2793_09220 [Flavobacteriaceae bacterium]
MAKTLKFFFLTFYTLGVFCLPMGNFSILKELPGMYSYCKANEHPDMNLFDFITDHILNIDGIFDKHQNNDDQKSHIPIHHTFTSYSTFLAPIVTNSFKFSNHTNLEVIENYKILAPETFSEYISKVFHPPITA